MVRAAAALVLPEGLTRTLEFKDHAWIQPVVVDAAFALTVVLNDNGEDEDGGRWLEYEILSEGGGETPHARGTVRCSAEDIDAEPVDLAAVDRAIEGANRDRDALYARFEALGLRYGPTMQGITDLRSDGDEVIARLHLPGAADPRFGLHPAMMDSAMQCTICLLAGLDGEAGAAVMPFAFDDMIVHGGTTEDMWVWVRRAPGASVAGMPALDIDLVDDQGLLRVSIRGLISRTVAAAPVVAAPVGASTRAVGAAPVPARPTALPASSPALRALAPIWNPVRFGPETVAPEPGERCLLLGGDETLFAWLRAAPVELRHQPIVAGDSVEEIARLLSDREFDHVFWFAPEADVGDHDAIVPSQDAGVLSLFRILKALNRLDWFERELKFTIVTRRALQVFDDERVSPHHAGVHGLVGSFAKELPLWRFRLLDIESIADLDPREMLALPWDEQGRGVAFRCDEWFRQEFADVGRLASPHVAYRQKGVYVVIGGAGGVGEVWTRHMVADYDAEVIWIGRRPLDAEIEAKLDAIAGLGRRPHYVSADATDAVALTAAVAAIRERFPRIDGVVHSALVLKDQTVRAMDEAVFRQSLAAKVDVSVAIERAFAGVDLDFVLFFSSVASFHRDAGQSNYCAGCTFKDSFAQAMRAEHPYPVKIVNWGYWGSVGIVADPFFRKRMESRGIGSIEPEEAMRALEAFVASDMDQLVMLKVLSQRALDDLWVSEEVRHYEDQDASSGYGGEALIAS
jgi:polyketide synthase PksM